ncbi:hypothetical protein WJ96_04730 [Burkholderia ubonensis]|uniref:Uncharacterized protein n=1 Tax=Burkholderia ubonensis TaxID=101571 RepID=A0AAW3MVB0_9BURK|nr:hypothetical protein WJ93_06570 [Burkholderia ubonensis]KVP97878.1 hypothetical protein WJ96_04730 [Burkholderia ubonensis]KVZ92575.1 hypothetical protein WL25_16385 [Burkholderia ubonensis]
MLLKFIRCQRTQLELGAHQAGLFKSTGIEVMPQVDDVARGNSRWHRLHEQLYRQRGRHERVGRQQQRYGLRFIRMFSVLQ